MYLFAACRPGTVATLAPELPRVSADAMTIFLDHFARQIEPGAHAILVLDPASMTREPCMHRKPSPCCRGCQRHLR
ncbi:hypothetical protein KBI52_04515 [Microvirga sp. HBU67558]|uniref:hypothetical protein n=1 Tax=Microvirga sp. HBU67558 TaxID=2824562 RepID=UPI001B3674C4|nr:hypothetical protein [Microvirga sp. HBU67558]MBQ0819486.1 hypothetical protein [Microvirga sp. HBU67558]